MSAVVHLQDYKELQGTPTLVLVDLHHSVSAPADRGESAERWRSLAHCRGALRHARASGFPIAFTRRIARSESLWASPECPPWIADFEPRRSDMVFDRQLPSCYANANFTEMVESSGGHYVLAGLFGETSLLATTIEAFHRDHVVTYLADASASLGCEDVSATTMKKAVTGIISSFAQVTQTQSWIRRTSRRIGVFR